MLKKSDQFKNLCIVNTCCFFVVLFLDAFTLSKAGAETPRPPPAASFSLGLDGGVYWRPIGGLLEARQRLYEPIVNAEQHSKSGEMAAIKVPRRLASGVNHRNNKP